MTKISIDDVKQLADLAKISISNDEAEKFRGEIEEILGYVEKLQSIDTTGVDPTLQVTGLVNVTREDKLIDYDVTQEELLSNVPYKKGSYIKVKRVLE